MTAADDDGKASTLKMNYWEQWGLHTEICPCDVHFNEWVEANAVRNKTVYHFGTGTHHIIGRHQAESGTGNVVLAITASKGEYDAYVSLIVENARVAKSYLVYFGDIYLSNARLLPDFDVVTLFHLCEYFSPDTASESYGGLDDRGLLDLFTAKTKPGGYILFYQGSNGFDKTQPIIAAWEKERPVERAADFKTLLVYRKTA